MNRVDIDPGELRTLIHYEPIDGTMTWIPRQPHQFEATPGRSAAHQCALWNSKHAGRPAFAAAGPDGYLRSRVKGQTYCGHRVAWAIYYGEWPSALLDHINGNRADIRIGNLREVDDTGNARNAALRRDNKSGVPGIYYRRATGRWLVTIGKKHVGSFRSFTDATAAKKAAEQAQGYHPNHGRINAMESMMALKQRAIAIRTARAG